MNEIPLSHKPEPFMDQLQHKMRTKNLARKTEKSYKPKQPEVERWLRKNTQRLKVKRRKKVRKPSDSTKQG